MAHHCHLLHKVGQVRHRLETNTCSKVAASRPPAASGAISPVPGAPARPWRGISGAGGGRPVLVTVAGGRAGGPTGRRGRAGGSGPAARDAPPARGSVRGRSVGAAGGVADGGGGGGDWRPASRPRPETRHADRVSRRRRRKRGATQEVVAEEERCDAGGGRGGREVRRRRWSRCEYRCMTRDAAQGGRGVEEERGKSKT